MLWHIMKIYSHYGYNEFVICLGVRGDVIKNYFHQFLIYNNDFTIDLAGKSIQYHNEDAQIDWKVTLVETGLNTLKGGRIKRVADYLDEDINMVTYGDGVADINIAELVQSHKAHGKILTITGVHPPARFGELIQDNGQVVTFTEKPQTSLGLINGGFMVFDRRLLDHLTTAEDCDFETGALEAISAHGEVMVFKHEGKWECMDHERDVAHLNELWNTNKAFWKLW